FESPPEPADDSSRLARFARSAAVVVRSNLNGSGLEIAARYSERFCLFADPPRSPSRAVGGGLTFEFSQIDWFDCYRFATTPPTDTQIHEHLGHSESPDFPGVGCSSFLVVGDLFDFVMRRSAFGGLHAR